MIPDNFEKKNHQPQRQNLRNRRKKCGGAYKLSSGAESTDSGRPWSRYTAKMGNAAGVEKLHQDVSPTGNI